MNALERTWEWYRDTREGLILLERLASRHWDKLSWDGPIGEDRDVPKDQGPELAARALGKIWQD